MLLRILNFLFFYGSWYTNAHAASAAGFDWMSIAPMVIIFGIFYFLMLRPQQQKLREHKEKLESIKKGDEVVVGGGLVGRVHTVEAEEIHVLIAPEIVVRCIKSSVSQVREAPKGAKIQMTKSPKKRPTKKDHSAE